jgi:sortase A
MQRGGRMVEPNAEPLPPQPVPMTVPALEALLQQGQPEAGMIALPASSAPTMYLPMTVDESLPVPRRKKRSRWYDRALIAVEVTAVLGIILIGTNLLVAAQNLERETASAQAMAEEQRRAGIPTLVPTPSLRLEDVVLPGGHTVSESGVVSFNYDEVPSHLIPLVESQWIRPVVARPQTTNETAVALIIPKLNINQVIVQGVDWEALQQGVGQMVNGADPADEVGNVVLAAHNDVYGELFRHVDQLVAGDTFQIQTQTTTYTYTVTDIFTVEPDDVTVLGSRDGATATLISCYPYRVNDERIVVYADRIA